MEIKKSIRDIKGSNPETISDMVPTKPIRTVIETHVEEEEMFIPPRDTEPKQSFFKKINKFYLMAFILILAGVLALIFVKSRAPTNPVEQAKKE